MTTASHVLPANSTAISKASFSSVLQLLVGFFFAYRLALTYLGFQSNPRAGSIVALSCSILFFAAAVVYTLGDAQFSVCMVSSSRTVRWLLAYLALSGCSLLWTAADSILDAGALWTVMALDVATVLLLIKRPRLTERTDALLKGFVVGMLFVGAVAWAGPTQPDLRIGDYEFLHPNTVAMYSAIAFFLAQHLALKESLWRWACLGLGMVMLRTLSKTTIIAFFTAEAFYLIREKQISRRVKIQIACVSLLVIAAFGTLFSAYLEIYTTAGGGTEVETLTGRTAIWATAFFMGLEKPLIGHGFYSFRALVPAFGVFEPWHAHNEVLQEFFEYGLLGVTVTAGLYFSLVSATKRFPKKALEVDLSSARSYGRLVSVVVLFAIIHGLTESVNFGLTIPLWLFAALALALQQTPLEARAL